MPIRIRSPTRNSVGTDTVHSLYIDDLDLEVLKRMPSVWMVKFADDTKDRDRHTFMKLYKQYVRPHLEFSSPAWSPWAVGDKENLERVQEKAVKMVAGLKSRDYKDRCKELGLETLEERREKQDVALVHKLVLSG
jgi:ribonuclease P/MRP protein subunit RPP40